ncbi:MAG: hypothetical protein LBU72_09620 [Burkholderiaceae bacterium]|jgi:YD repeat-containing protein|nr:hypothetical protein [Burkholderiaceae bacterium]
MDEELAIAQKAGMDMVALKRTGDAPIPLPAVVHWKVGHYAALVGKHQETAGGQTRTIYHVIDPTFGRDQWISQQALNSESSGMFLVPTGSVKPQQESAQASAHVPARNAAADWQQVALADLKQYNGRGYLTQPSPIPPTPPPCNSGCCGGGPAGGGGGGAPGVGMCASGVTRPQVSLRLFDTPVGYTPPIGYDVHTTLTYNQLDTAQPASMDYSNIGPQWNTSWGGYIQDNPTLAGTSVELVASGGGSYDYTGYNSADGTFTRETSPTAQLVLVSTSPVRYERRFADGSKEVYATSNGATAYPRRVFLSQIVDPQGNILTLGYDTNLRLTSIQDAIGQSTTFSYGNAANQWLITAITDPFGRKAQLAYDSQGRLTSITDVIGITSSFDYSGTGTDITALHTPYGTTSFVSAIASTTRSLTITDPLGHTNRTELNASVTLPDDKPPTTSWSDGNQGYRNTFY